MKTEVRREVREDGATVEWVYRGGALLTKRTIPPSGAQAMTRNDKRRAAIRNQARRKRPAA